jgi:hypothetical protein
MPGLPKRPGLASDRNMVRMPKDNRPNFDAAAIDPMVRPGKAARDGYFDEEFEKVFAPETGPRTPRSRSQRRRTRNGIRMSEENRPNFTPEAAERIGRLAKALQDGRFHEEFNKVFPPEKRSPQESAPVPKDPKR